MLGCIRVYMGLKGRSFPLTASLDLGKLPVILSLCADAGGGLGRLGFAPRQAQNNRGSSRQRKPRCQRESPARQSELLDMIVADVPACRRYVCMYVCRAESVEEGAEPWSKRAGFWRHWPKFRWRSRYFAGKAMQFLIGLQTLGSSGICACGRVRNP